MSVYGKGSILLVHEDNQYLDEDIICEAFLDKDTFDLIKKWKTSNEIHKEREFKSSTVTDEEYNELKEAIDIMKNQEKSYGEYKKAFNKLCKYCHIVPTGVIITKYDIKKGKEDNNSLYVKYSENTKKIHLPDGVRLYHMSKVPGIKKLIPAFRGKSEKGYLYDKPRIYFTIRKFMPKFLADYKLTDKMHKYMVKKDIKDVYVDPLVWSNTQGAVYIETKSPVEVEEMGIPKEDVENKQETANESGFDIDSFLTFVSEMGIEVCVEE